MKRLRLTPARIAFLLVAGVLLGLGVGYAATLSTASASLWAGQQTLTKRTCSLGASAASDTWVDEGSPSSTNGSDTSLSVQSKNHTLQYAFIRFDLASCGVPTTGGADSATLTLTVTGATKTNHTIALYPVYSSWSPSTLTWNLAQSLTVASTATATFPAATGVKTLTVTADVDAAIKAGSLWGWELVDASNGTATTTIASSSAPSAGDRPTLTIAGEQ